MSSSDSDSDMLLFQRKKRRTPLLRNKLKSSGGFINLARKNTVALPSKKKRAKSSYIWGESSSDDDYVAKSHNTSSSSSDGSSPPSPRSLNAISAPISPVRKVGRISPTHSNQSHASSNRTSDTEDAGDFASQLIIPQTMSTAAGTPLIASEHHTAVSSPRSKKAALHMSKVSDLVELRKQLESFKRIQDANQMSAADFLHNRLINNYQAGHLQEKERMMIEDLAHANEQYLSESEEYPQSIDNIHARLIYNALDNARKIDLKHFAWSLKHLSKNELAKVMSDEKIKYDDEIRRIESELPIEEADTFVERANKEFAIFADKYAAAGDLISIESDLLHGTERALNKLKSSAAVLESQKADVARITDKVERKIATTHLEQKIKHTRAMIEEGDLLVINFTEGIDMPAVRFRKAGDFMIKNTDAFMTMRNKVFVAPEGVPINVNTFIESNDMKELQSMGQNEMNMMFEEMPEGVLGIDEEREMFTREMYSAVNSSYDRYKAAADAMRLNAQIEPTESRILRREKEIQDMIDDLQNQYSSNTVHEDLTQNKAHYLALNDELDHLDNLLQDDAVELKEYRKKRDQAEESRKAKLILHDKAIDKSANKSNLALLVRKYVDERNALQQDIDKIKHLRKTRDSKIQELEQIKNDQNKIREMRNKLKSSLSDDIRRITERKSNLDKQRAEKQEKAKANLKSSSDGDTDSESADDKDDSEELETEDDQKKDVIKAFKQSISNASHYSPESSLNVEVPSIVVMNIKQLCDLSRQRIKDNNQSIADKVKLLDYLSLRVKSEHNDPDKTMPTIQIQKSGKMVAFPSGGKKTAVYVILDRIKKVRESYQVQLDAARADREQKAKLLQAFQGKKSPRKVKSSKK